MPYSIQWHIQNRIVYVKFTGPLTTSDIEGASAEAAKYVSAGTAPVHMIALYEGVDKIPMDVRKTSSMNTYLSDPKIGWVVQVGGNAVLNFFISVASQLTKLRLTKRDNFTQAMEFIISQDASLKDAPLVER